jgi:hypothetical protein
MQEKPSSNVVKKSKWPNLEGALENLGDPLDSEDAKLLDVVRDLLNAHAKLESKYWPALAIFLERLEKGLPVKRVTSDFHNAYRQANPKSEVPAYWYFMVNEIRRIALMGRSWIEEHRAKDFGFWKLLELADFELEEPKKKRRGKDRTIRNKHFRYFLTDEPAEFPFLFALWTEGKVKLPNLNEREHHKDLKVYERMCVRLLDRMLAELSFFFDPELNWPSFCQRILQQIQPAQVRELLKPGVVRVVPTILDIDTETNC